MGSGMDSTLCCYFQHVHLYLDIDSACYLSRLVQGFSFLSIYAKRAETDADSTKTNKLSWSILQLFTEMKWLIVNI